LIFTPFIPGVEIVQPRAGTIDVVGCSQSVVGSIRFSVGRRVAVRVGLLEPDAVDAAVGAVVGSVDGVAATSRSDPQPDATITTTIAMAAPLDDRTSRSLHQPL